jgi:alanine dehydrogenase
MPGVAPGQVVILGGGIVGTEAARTAIGLGAKVAILDINVDRLAYLETLFGSRAELIYSNPSTVETWVIQADLLVGAVLIPGQKAPNLVPQDLVRTMEAGSVIMDVAVDQGGCIETLEVTSYSNPTYHRFGIVHCGIPNLPGAVPQTSTQALGNSTLTYILALADYGLEALQKNLPLAKGLNVQAGKLIHPAVQSVFTDLAA